MFQHICRVLVHLELYFHESPLLDVEHHLLIAKIVEDASSIGLSLLVGVPIPHKLLHDHLPPEKVSDDGVVILALEALRLGEVTLTALHDEPPR